jgi:hypothetical protein
MARLGLASRMSAPSRSTEVSTSKAATAKLETYWTDESRCETANLISSAVPTTLGPNSCR